MADDPISRLCAAIEAQGARVRRPADLGAVEAVERLVAPLRLPPILRELWTRLQVESIPVTVLGREPGSSGSPRLCDPAVSYAAWSNIRDHRGTLPEALVPVSVVAPPLQAAGRLRLVELDGPDAVGRGAAYEWTIGEDAIIRRAESPDAWLRVHADEMTSPRTMIDRSFDRVRWVVKQDGFDAGLAEQHQAIAPADCPPAWREAASVFEDRRQRSALTSVARLRWARPLENALGAQDAADVRGVVGA